MNELFLIAVEAATKAMGAAPTLHVWSDEDEHFFVARWGEDLQLSPAINGVYATSWTPKGKEGRNAAALATGGSAI